MTEYVPNTEQVKRYWLYGAEAWARDVAILIDKPDPADGVRPSEQFDAWLKRHDREVAAKTLRYAADDLTPGDDKVDDWGIEASLLRARAAYYERGEVDV